MHSDSALAALSSPWDRDIDGSSHTRTQAPEGDRSVVAEDSVRAAGQNRSEPPALRREATMADGVDAAVDPMEPSGRRPVVDLRLREAQAIELPGRDHSMLPSGERGDLVICWTT